ncbi:MAG TPA: hypothetical protein VFB28_14555 [Terriglobales bacterium]|nr:hypothetical protein [Terriglobales bacterium]
MRMSTGARYRWIAGVLPVIATLFLLFPSLLLAQKDENPQVASLLKQARDEAVKLSRDADDMESLTRSEVSWESHAAMLERIKEHVNDLGKLAEKMETERGSASPWQQQAIDRMIPLMKDLASNTTAAIDHINQNKLRPTAGDYPEYLKENAETAHELSTMISDFVAYGQARAKLEKLEQRLEIAQK